MLYFTKTPKWLQLLYPKRVWEMDVNKKEIYLTFDDGPHASVTDFVLDELKKFNAKATFFCIGKNVKENPDVFQKIIDEGHSIGNHTQNHLNGFKTNDKVYVDDVLEAAKYIKSNFFRPPYGRLKIFQSKVLKSLKQPFQIIMWTVLSGDFDKSISPQRCLENVLLKTRPGSIIVFHDSEKAAENLMFALPKILKTLTEKGYIFNKISFFS